MNAPRQLRQRPAQRTTGTTHLDLDHPELAKEDRLEELAEQDGLVDALVPENLSDSDAV